MSLSVQFMPFFLFYAITFLTLIVLQRSGSSFCTGARRHCSRPRVGTYLPIVRVQPEGCEKPEGRVKDEVYTSTAETSSSCSLEILITCN